MEEVSATSITTAPKTVLALNQMGLTATETTAPIYQTVLLKGPALERLTQSLKADKDLKERAVAALGQLSEAQKPDVQAGLDKLTKKSSRVGPPPVAEKRFKSSLSGNQLAKNGAEQLKDWGLGHEEVLKALEAISETQSTETCYAWLEGLIKDPEQLLRTDNFDPSQATGDEKKAVEARAQQIKEWSIYKLLRLLESVNFINKVRYSELVRRSANSEEDPKVTNAFTESKETGEKFRKVMKLGLDGTNSLASRTAAYKFFIENLYPHGWAEHDFSVFDNAQRLRERLEKLLDQDLARPASEQIYHPDVACVLLDARYEHLKREFEKNGAAADVEPHSQLLKTILDNEQLLASQSPVYGWALSKSFATLSSQITSLANKVIIRAPALLTPAQSADNSQLKDKISDLQEERHALIRGILHRPNHYPVQVLEIAFEERLKPLDGDVRGRLRGVTNQLKLKNQPPEFLAYLVNQEVALQRAVTAQKDPKSWQQAYVTYLEALASQDS